MHENRDRPRKDLSKEKKDWMIEFLSRSDMKYTDLGRQVNVYVEKVDDEQKYLPREYFLWTLSDLLDIINGIESNFVSTFSEKPRFSQLYDFTKTHKQFIYNKDTPHTSCLCDTCENTVLFAKGLNKRLPSSSRLPENPHDIVEKYSCSSDNKQCMSNNYKNCSSGELCQLFFNLPTESDTDSSSEFDDSNNLVSFYRWETPDKHITKIQIREPFEEAAGRFKKAIVSLKSHIYSKRAQNRHYNLVKESLDHLQILVHVDYVESYKSSQQNEIQSVYLGNTTFSIFTACCYTKSLDDDGGLKKDSIVVISESKDHDRAAAINCVKKVIEKSAEINAASYDKIHIWGDRFRHSFVHALYFVS